MKLVNFVFLALSRRANYQIALKLSERAYEVFEDLSRQPTSLTRDDSYVFTKLEESLVDLNSMVRGNVSAQDLMAVNPYLQAAYDLIEGITRQLYLSLFGTR